ncbi:heparin lyase I family protein [Paraburkholderia phytofirmans]|uniref:heparin lyase I family protein n=1 Tax=Paraburkholderia phytofirmans TaxID=261302 RepID=UPI0038B7BE88
MKRLKPFLCVFVLSCCWSAHAQDLSMQWSDPTISSLGSTFTTLARSDWQAGLGLLSSVQSPSADNVTIVDDPFVAGRKVVQVYVRSGQNYSQVANGSVRAEMVFKRDVKFVQKQDYLVRWSTYIPASYVFDPKLLMVITQIHQSALAGSPAMELDLNGSNYVVSVRGNSHEAYSKQICCASQDQGKWVNWALRYVPDSSGAHASTQLWKNGVAVFATQGVPNAYPGDNDAYLKMGIYLLSPFQSLNQITLLFGEVTIGQQ